MDFLISQATSESLWENIMSRIISENRMLGPSSHMLSIVIVLEVLIDNIFRFRASLTGQGMCVLPNMDSPSCCSTC